jgi:3-hydroxyacyl-CoA dehydrogenase/3-hydroxy-2-methylbutyryl-CoA dehydrogenase
VRLHGTGAIVTGGASGLGAATASALLERGARVAIVDLDGDKADERASELGDAAVAHQADVTVEADVERAVAAASRDLGGIRLAVSCAGVGWAERVVGRSGPAQLQPFETVVRVNLIGTFNVLRYAAAEMAGGEADGGGERGVVVMTASIAAYDGQIGQTAYAASKGGVVSLTLPAARDLARSGVRVCTIAPGTFDTPLLAALPQEARDALAEQIPHPSRLGAPSEYAELACHIAENPMLNGETIRLDGALRMPPK